MIADILDNYRIYSGVHRDFDRAFAALARASTMELPLENNAKIEVDGFQIVVQHYETRDYSEKKYEGHRKNIDIQCVLKGREINYWASTSGLSPVTDYNEQRDHLNYGDGPGYSPIRLSDRQFAVFFPGDAHKTGCTWDSKSQITKLIVKVRL
jgi:biofilm protein TabA